MTSSTTTETIKVLLHLQKSTCLLLILFLLIALFLFVLGIFEEDVWPICVSIITTAVIGMFAFNSLVPLKVTKTTQVTKESPQILQVDEKLLSSEGLTLFLKDSHGNYKKKEITVNSDTKIKEGNDYNYTQVRTKVSYHPKSELRAIFSDVPHGKTITKTTLTVPKGTLTQKK